MKSRSRRAGDLFSRSVNSGHITIASRPPAEATQTLVGTSALIVIARAKASLLFGVVLVAISNLQAQVSPPSATDVSPTVNSEVSSLIHTGCGYDAWTGSVHRSVTDLEVPGAVSSLGLKWVRTYNSGNPVDPWSFSWTWRYWGRGWGGDAIAVHLPDGGIWRTSEPGMKLRWEKSCENCDQGTADLHLEDGSRVHMEFTTDYPEPGQSPAPPLVDHYQPQYVEDPYGRRTTLEYETPCGDPQHMYPELIRLKRITDPSGRWIKITYACGQNGVCDCDNSTWWKITDVTGSDGSSVHYTWGIGGITRVDYNHNAPGADSAYYTYGNTTFIYWNCCNFPDCSSQCPYTGTASKLIAAWDTHADTPMQSIYYDYKANGSFEGQIRAEKQLASANPTASPSAGVAVSTFTSNSCPTHPWSQSPDCPSATQTETRGDGPSRTIYLQQAAQHVPLVKRKSDFNGINEVYTYDGNNYLTDVADRNGFITHYTNEQVVGNPIQIRHPDQTHVDYTYSDPDNPYHISTVTNERGKMTTYTRDSNNRITRIDYPADANTPSSYETFTYNSFGQVLTHRRKNGYYEHAAYSNGLLRKVWNPTATASYPPSDDEPHITLSYYASPGPSATPHPWQDRVQTVTYPSTGIGQVPSETYEYDRALAGGVTDPNGAPVHGRGLVTKIIHADSTYRSFGYDIYGNKRWEENELRNRTSFTYDDYKRLRTVTNPLGQITRSDYAPTEGNTGQSYMHTADLPYWVTTPGNIKTHNVYDANFRKTSTTAAYGTPLAATTSHIYDNAGNLTQVTDPRSKLTVDSYDTRNRKTSTTEASGTSLARTTTWHYDEASNIYQIDRPDGTHETKSYDALNRVLTDTVPQTSSINLTTTFIYNPSGTIASVTDANNHTTTFGYDASDQKITMTYPNNSGTQTWEWDNVHNPKWRITVNTQTVEVKYFYYDSRNRLYATWWYNWNDSVRTPDWCYFGYDDASRLTEAENGTAGWGSNIISDVHRHYDAADKLTLEEQNVTGLGMKSVNYPNYDADGRLTRMNVSGVSDYDYTFSYDAMGRFEKIFITNSIQLFQYQYDPASNEIERDNVYVQNWVKQIYPRDDLNRMLYLDVKKGTSTLGHEGYVYDSMNRLRSVAREDNKTDSFTYYLDGELNTAQYNTARSVNYALDKAGNRTSVVDNGTTKNYSHNVLNQYTTGHSSSVTNGPEHEISDYQGVHYTYINDERVKQASDGSNTYTLTYDALGRCVKRKLNETDTYYVYDGEKPILEYNLNGTRVGFNLYGKGIDEILERGANGTDNQWHWYFFQQDHEGSVTHLTDTSGNIIERYRYDAFGAPSIYASNWSTRSSTIYDNRFLFTGREYAATYRSTYNPSFNFYEYRARVYNPTLGRFMSEDPKQFDAGDYNLFRYCHNDPLDMTDPMGLGELPGIKAPASTYEMDHTPIARALGRQALEVFRKLAGLSATVGQVGASGIRVERAIPINGQRDPLLDARTERNLRTLVQPVSDMARAVIYHARADLGLDVRVIQGTRTYAEQNALYAQGRTATGPRVTNAPGGFSFHNFGVAFDVGLFRGRSYIDGGSGYLSVGRVGEGVGLEWGGRWRSFQDIPHFQYPGLSLSVLRSRFEQGLPPISGY